MDGVVPGFSPAILTLRNDVHRMDVSNEFVCVGVEFLGSNFVFGEPLLATGNELTNNSDCPSW